MFFDNIDFSKFCLHEVYRVGAKSFNYFKNCLLAKNTKHKLYMIENYN